MDSVVLSVCVVVCCCQVAVFSCFPAQSRPCVMAQALLKLFLLGHTLWLNLLLALPIPTGQLIVSGCLGFHAHTSFNSSMKPAGKKLAIAKYTTNCELFVLMDGWMDGRMDG